jgi:ribosomal protein S12 methylthiotransferase accessory factor
VLAAPTFNQQAVSEHNNIVDHFIDSTGVISWKFFSEKSDYDFSAWDFSGSTQQEFNYLMDILRQLEKEVYIADYEELGAKACRILVPDYSEIYLPEDLVWDNHNKGLAFRADILNLHALDNKALSKLVKRLEDSELDAYTKISDLIGVAFEETAPWGQLDVGELKCLIYLALKKFEQAKELVEMFLNFNDNTLERRKFYQALNTVLDIELNEELDLADYRVNLVRMYGEEVMGNAIGSVSGEVRFFGLTPTNNKLEGLEKHLKLIASYQKLQSKRAKFL